MAVEAIAWPAEPTVTDGDDSADYNLGLRFSLVAGGDCPGARWRVPDSVATPTPGSHYITLWRVTGELQLAIKAFTPVPGGYQDILFDAAVTLDPGELYVIAVYTRHYVYRLPSGWPVTSPSANIVGDEGRLVATSAGPLYPPSFANAWYYISPLMETGGGPEPTPDGVAVPVALGTPAVGLGLAPVPGGLAVPVAVTSPGVGPASAPDPAGLAVPVALGTPAVGYPLSPAPAGLAVPVALGTPAVGLGLGPVPDGVAVPVGLGTPAVSELVTPDGVAVPVALGTPAVGLGLGPVPDGVALPIVLGTPILEVAAVQPGSVAVPLTLGTPAVTTAASPTPTGIPIPVALGVPAVGPAVPVTALPVMTGTATVVGGPTGVAVVLALSGTATIT